MFPTSAIDAEGTHRLRPRRRKVPNRLADDAAEAQALAELEDATDALRLGEANLLPGIGAHELLFGLPYAAAVNAAFCASPPRGSRFSGPLRGAWYASLDGETAAREAAFHKAHELREIDRKTPEMFAFDDWLADFHADFYDLRMASLRARILDPIGYRYSQRLARQCLAEGAGGFIYRSVRCRGGERLACFRTALVSRVRRAEGVTIGFEQAFAAPAIEAMPA